MIFAHTLDKVLCGTKWQTRRLVKRDEVFDVQTHRVMKRNQRTLYQVGKTYAVQPNRGKKAIARIKLTGLRKETVGAITDFDAQAEGFDSRKDFLTTWQEIHTKNASLDSEVWVLEFELYAIVVELETFYGREFSSNRSADHGNDLPVALTRIPGVGMHGGYHQCR